MQVDLRLDGAQRVWLDGREVATKALQIMQEPGQAPTVTLVFEAGVSGSMEAMAEAYAPTEDPEPEPEPEPDEWEPIGKGVGGVKERNTRTGETRFRQTAKPRSEQS